MTVSGRKKLIFGNWKMHFSVKQSVAFATKLADKEVPDSVEVAVAPNTLAIAPVSDVLSVSKIATISQNAYYKDEGAFTGEVSMPMLRGVAKYVLVGHSERRHVFHESNELVRHKVAAAVRSSIKPILCVGETLVEREHFHTKQVVHDQLTSGLCDLTAEEVARMVIAYEPVWAIGTGKYAHPDDAVKVAAHIRSVIASLYGHEPANKVRILYGGSVSSENATSYISSSGIDGLLVGGASLSLAKFWPIVAAAQKVQTTKSNEGRA